MRRKLPSCGGAVILAVFLLGTGCASRPVPENRARAALACQPVDHLEPLLVRGAGLLLGEMHGTVESPAFVANAACLALRAGLSVTVALEMPHEEQAKLEVFLSSGGTQKDRAALLDSPFWQAEYQDGRRSEAMLSLLDKLRHFREQSYALRVILIDKMEMPRVPTERDLWMGEALAQSLSEMPDGVVIALAGNLHTRISRGTPWDPNYEPAGLILASKMPGVRLTSLDVSYQGGTAWFCTSGEPSSCQVRSVRGRPDAQVGRVVLFPQVTNGYHGVYEVGALTASPPARQSPAPN